MATNIQSAAQVSTGWTEAAARTWVENDTRSQELAVPWRIAAEFFAHSVPGASLVLDIASGSGSFLAFALEALPNARGIWLDFSETMLERAKINLSPFSDRVEFVLADILDVKKVTKENSLDIVLTSRATHHLGVPGLGEFYLQVASQLRSEGWIANLDLFRLEGPWDQWIRNVRDAVMGPVPATMASHPQERPLPYFDDHLASMRAAGFGVPNVPWKVFRSALFIGQKQSN